MSNALDNKRQSRRTFFRQGSTALAAGLVSASTGASVLTRDDTTAHQQLAALQKRLAELEDRDALQALFLSYHSLLQAGAFSALVGLFTTDASVHVGGQHYQGRQTGLQRLFVEGYAQETLDSLQCAFSRDHNQQDDRLSIAEDDEHASGRFHARVQWYRPLQGSSVLESMARQQGMAATRYWEKTRFDVQFAREDGQWKIHQLVYLQS